MDLRDAAGLDTNSLGQRRQVATPKRAANDTVEVQLGGAGRADRERARPADSGMTARAPRILADPPFDAVGRPRKAPPTDRSDALRLQVSRGVSILTAGGHEAQAVRGPICPLAMSVERAGSSNGGVV